MEQKEIIAVGSDGFIDPNEGSIGNAKVKWVATDNSRGGFLRVYFKIKRSGAKSESLALVKDGKVVGLRGPFNAILPCDNEGIMVPHDAKLYGDPTADALEIARKSVIPDGKYYLYVLHHRN